MILKASSKAIQNDEIFCIALDDAFCHKAIFTKY